ncbi:unnamed protein product [Parascedosporium putredinis]|uniref:Uncharacterized protein n=1 Tax=Parascedosporium putredinis TaxID=1442378 RepID=A0A9P1M8Q7_9PEZI|nr:unnamed protein product [Parascedosporium putredinis]CAI7990565.1 unnamed protein product [Parascedosporium putredinis]
MYGSYGSYSSIWPRRSVLSSGSSCDEHRATSYLSDEDLFPVDTFEEDDATSVSSTSSSFASPIPAVQVLSGSARAELGRQRQAMQKEYVKMLISEKEKRKAAAKKQRRPSASSKKSSKKTVTMGTIVESE